jgi:hypothetical protein
MVYVLKIVHQNSLFILLFMLIFTYAKIEYHLTQEKTKKTESINLYDTLIMIITLAQ